MPKAWVHHKRRGTRPPTSPGCRTPPPQKLRQQNTKSPQNLRLRAHKTETRDARAVDQLIKDTKHMHTEPQRKNTDENITNKNNTSGDKLESETLRPLTPEGHTGKTEGEASGRSPGEAMGSHTSAR